MFVVNDHAFACQNCHVFHFIQNSNQIGLQQQQKIENLSIVF